MTTRTAAAAPDIASSISMGWSRSPSTLPTKVSANQAAAPLMIRALASDNEEAMTKMLVHPMFCSNSRHDNRPIPGSKITVMAMRAGTAGGSPWAKSVNQSRAVPKAISPARISLLCKGPAFNSREPTPSGRVKPDL